MPNITILHLGHLQQQARLEDIAYDPEHVRACWISGIEGEQILDNLRHLEHADAITAPHHTDLGVRPTPDGARIVACSCGCSLIAQRITAREARAWTLDHQERASRAAVHVGV